MGLTDAQLGKIILVVSITLFSYYTLCLWVPPFMSSSALFMNSTLFPPVRYILFVPALSGLLFIGGLVIFTTISIRNA